MKPAQKFFLPSSLLRDARHEPLTIILEPYRGVTHVPADLGSGDVACLVFIQLQNCFQKSGKVAEGMMHNIIWGFQECGFEPKHVAAGLTALRKLGYVQYTDEFKNELHELNFNNPQNPIWIRYTKKMTDLFVREVVS